MKLLSAPSFRAALLRAAVLPAAVLLMTALLASPAAAQETRDPAAVAVAQRMHAAMGGLDAWNNTRYIRFDFKVGPSGELPAGRAHLWDKWEGRYRLEQTTAEGKTQVVLFNAYQKAGEVYEDGVKLPAEQAAPLIERAHAAFINDTYWLAMPWKWLDPGVSLRSLGEQDHGGKTYDVVELSFNGVGLTPGDRYKAFVAKGSNLMERWEYALQGGNTGAWDWTYAEPNGIKLAATHHNAEGREINMGPVKAASETNEAHFTDPGAMLR